MGEERAELRDLRKDQYSRVETALLRDSRIAYGLKALYALLITYGPTRIFPGQTTLGDCLGVKRETINRWLKQLKQFGLITWRRRKGTSNLYAILGYERSRLVDVILQSQPDVTEESHPLLAVNHNGCEQGITQTRSTQLDPFNEVWSIVLAELEMQMTKATFNRWLLGSTASKNGDTVTVHVRDHYAVEWLEARWTVPITRTLTGVTGEACEVRFEEG